MRRRVPRCVVCGMVIPPLSRDRGSPVHSQECGRVLLERILISVPGVIDLLPDEWRGDRNGGTALPEDHSKVRRARVKAAEPLPPRVELTDEQLDEIADEFSWVPARDLGPRCGGAID